jgi:signal transduction histidine kinase/HAMP domain-containing protein
MLSRVGVRGRLVLSFVGISGFAVLATAAAMYSFLEVRALLDTVTQRRLPTALAAQELSARVERIVAETPTLLAASTPDERSEIWNRLGAEIEEVDKLLVLLRARGFAADAFQSLQNLLDPLRSNLVSLNALVGERIVLADRKAVLLAEMRKAHEDTLAVLGPWVTNVSNEVQRLRAAVEASRLAIQERSATQTELIASLSLLASLHQILQVVVETHDSLVAMASADEQERLKLLLLRAQWSLEALNTLATTVGPQPRQLVRAEVERVRQSVDGENNMPALRARELALLANAEDVMRQNARLSQELTESVESLVRGTKQDIAQATSQARAAQTRSSITLVLIVSLSVASSVLIVWLYVSRNLLARLTALSNSMLAIADGHLRATLPPIGSDEIGRMAAALTVFRDTAVEVEEKNLREIAEARQRLIDAIESISEGFSLYDKDDRLVLSNSRYRHLLYAGIEEALQPGTPFLTIIRTAAERGLISDAAGRVDEWVAERLAHHRNPTGPHVQRRDTDRWIQVSERRTVEGGTVAVYTDITQLKGHEAQLAQLVKKLEIARDQAMEANRAKSQFLASMSHELRTPMNAILGFNEMILDEVYGEVRPELKTPLAHIQNSGRHLLRLINNVLDLSKIEAGRMELTLTDYLVQDAVESVRAAFSSLAAQKGLDFVTSVPADLPLAQGDVGRITQCLMNLAGNALKFTREGRVELAVELRGDVLYYRVMDTGIGIAKDQLETVFGEFRQGDPTITSEFGGTGLGLSITRKFVEMHGGRVWVESELGQGSTFCFTIPLRVELGKPA